MMLLRWRMHIQWLLQLHPQARNLLHKARDLPEIEARWIAATPPATCGAGWLLGQIVDGKLSRVSAPAGFGKTRLVAS
jgi:hypothetical protein